LEKKIGEPCVLEDCLCTGCGECDRCDLDPTKQCDNCGQCIQTLDGDFAEIIIDDILINEKTSNDLKIVSRRKNLGNKYKINSKDQ
jgi:D-arabinose 1-dehydrogenase-like Zn-dependent alcohol dehydrogenase